MYGVSESMWRSGQALRPYFEDVKRLVAAKDEIPEFTGYNIVEANKLGFVHFPIKVRAKSLIVIDSLQFVKLMNFVLI
jgi:hypothetical protein